MISGIGSSNKRLSKQAGNSRPINTRDSGSVRSMATGRSVKGSLAGYKKTASAMLVMKNQGYDSVGAKKARYKNVKDPVINYNKGFQHQSKKRDIMSDYTKSDTGYSSDKLINSYVKKNNLF